MNSKKNIIFISVLFLLFFIFLSVRELHYQNYLTGGHSWFLYFNDTKDNDLNFTIENYSGHQNFHWALYADDNQIQDGSATVAAGTQKTASPQINFSNNSGQKLTIKVIADKEERDIYKLLTQN